MQRSFVFDRVFRNLIALLGVLLLSSAPVASAFTAGPNIAVTALDISAVEGVPLDNIVTATVVDSSGGAGPLSATIDWGDGSATSAGVIVANSQDRFITRLYQDLLGRTPSSAELTVGLTLGTSQLVNVLIDSQEYRTTLVQSLYQRFLHRDADPAGITFALNLLSSGGTSDQLTAILLGSAEYFIHRGGGTNAGFISALYMDLLGRAPDSAGSIGFLSALNSGTPRSQIVLSILNSTERRTLVIQGLYTRLLGRPVDNVGLQFYLSAFAQGTTVEEVTVLILISAEYGSHAGAVAGTYDVLGTHTYSASGQYTMTVSFDNAATGQQSDTATVTVGDGKITTHGRVITRRGLFLSHLFQDELGRPADPFEFSSLLPYIEQSGRQAGGRALLLSSDFAQKEVADLFNRFLGRQPGDMEISGLVPAVHSGGERVSAKILGSEEYFMNHGSTRTNFINGLYQDLLGRTAQPGEINALIGLLRKITPASRQQVARHVLALPGSRAAMIQQLYQRYLGRSANTGSLLHPGELERAMLLLKRGKTWEDLAAFLVGSQEYFNRTINGFEAGTQFTAILGTFIDENPFSIATDFAALIDWGDGSPASGGTITKQAGVYYVSGTHTYVNEGTYDVKIHVTSGRDSFDIDSQVQLTSAIPEDVTDDFTVIRGNAVFNAQTKTTTQRIVLTSKSATPVKGPLYVLINGLPVSVSLTSGDGFTSNVEPIGSPYVKIDLANDLTAGQRVVVNLQFANPLHVKVGYRTKIAAGAGLP